MKIETTAGALHAALKTVKPAVQNWCVVPVLQCVLFDRNNVYATDLDFQIRTTFAATKAEGRAAVLFKPLCSILGCLPKEANISLTAGSKGGPAVLRYAEGECEIPTLEAPDFPLFEKSPDTVCDIENAGELVPALATALSCASTEETRYYLNGVHLHTLDNGTVRAVATDGHRMACVDTGATGALPANVIIPTFAVRAMVDLGALKRLTLDSKNRLWAAYPGVTLAAKLIDGTFPDYRRVIPDADKVAGAVEFDRFALSRAVGRLHALKGRDRRAVHLCFDDRHVALALSHVLDEARGRELVPLERCEGLDGLPDAVSISVDYFRDMLSVFKKSPTLRMAIVDAGGPIRFTGHDDKVLYVQMPMHGADSSYARGAFDILRPATQEAA